MGQREENEREREKEKRKRKSEREREKMREREPIWRMLTQRYSAKLTQTRPGRPSDRPSDRPAPPRGET